MIGTASGATTGVATVNATCVTMAGTGTGNSSFTYALSSNTGWSSSTPNQSVSGAYTEVRCDDPIFQPGVTYKFKACDDVGCGATATFTMASLIPEPTTNFSVTGNAFIVNAGDPNWVIMHIWDVYTLIWGSYFLLLLISLVFMNVTIKQKSVAISFLLVLISGATLFLIAPPELVQIGIMMTILAFTGLMYWVYKGKR
jgi:hypothetical protein